MVKNNERFIGILFPNVVVIVIIITFVRTSNYKFNDRDNFSVF